MHFISSFGVVVLLYSSLCNAEMCTLSAVPPDPKSGCCGRPVGVDKSMSSPFAQISEYPWMGIIEYHKDRTIKLACSAVLISGRYMLSAAQCFVEPVGNPTHVRLGEYNTKNDGPDCFEILEGYFLGCNDGALKIPIEKVIMHPNYNEEKSFEHDIALIRLANMAPKTDYIQPICLPTSDITVAPPKRLWIAGWGVINDANADVSERLLHVDLPFVDIETCRSVFNISFVHFNLGNGQLCAGGELWKAPCKGDSGGPLMIVREDITELAGIISFGEAHCGTGYPNVYTKVFAYDSWIRASNIEA